MRSWGGVARLSVAAVGIGSAVSAGAQSRSSDNAVTQAEDAFGFSVGRETLGIYSAGYARGFSPTSAGNVCIYRPYIYPGEAFALSPWLPRTIAGSSSLKVGPSGQG